MVLQTRSDKRKGIHRCPAWRKAWRQGAYIRDTIESTYVQWNLRLDSNRKFS